MKNTIKLLFLGLFLFGITATRAQISTATGGTLSPNAPTTNTNVGINTITPSEKLEVVGNIKVSGTATFASTITAPTFNISGQTASTIASFDAAKNIVSLPTVTYPSLSELSFVKGVTSSIQTQLNNKSAILPFASNTLNPVLRQGSYSSIPILDYTVYAPVASPTFTGVPAAPTAALGTNTTQLATTAFVLANAAPKIGGSAATAEYLKYNDGPRNLTDRLPNTFTRSVHYDFVTAATTSSSGNYAGVMTYNNLDGITSSTGDSSGQTH